MTQNLLAKLEQMFYSNPSNVLAQNICTQYDPFQIALSRQRLQDQYYHSNFFTKEVIKILCDKYSIIIYTSVSLID